MRILSQPDSAYRNTVEIQENVVESKPVWYKHSLLRLCKTILSFWVVSVVVGSFADFLYRFYVPHALPISLANFSCACFALLTFAELRNRDTALRDLSGEVAAQRQILAAAERAAIIASTQALPKKLFGPLFDLSREKFHEATRTDFCLLVYDDKQWQIYVIDLSRPVQPPGIRALVWHFRLGEELKLRLVTAGNELRGGYEVISSQATCPFRPSDEPVVEMIGESNNRWIVVVCGSVSEAVARLTLATQPKLQHIAELRQRTLAGRGEEAMDTLFTRIDGDLTEQMAVAACNALGFKP